MSPKEIADGLSEPNVDLVKRLYVAIGEERTVALYNETLELEAKGGLMRRDKKDERRSPGGVFFFLAKNSMPKEQKREIFPPLPRAEKNKRHKKAQKKVKHVPSSISWEEAKGMIAEALREKGVANTVKVTLIGRPNKVVQQRDCVMVAVKGAPPTSLPKGLPDIPEGSAISWAVFIARKQWIKVEDSLKGDPQDRLIIEGYPLVSKNGVAAVWATSVKSVAMEKEIQAAKKETPSVTHETPPKER